MLIFSILNKKLNIKYLLILSIFTHCIFASAQNSFRINDGKGKFTVPFELVNNLVIVPIEINGLELSFLLDTGVDATILFSLGNQDTLDLKNTESIMLRGLGDGEPIKALKSSGNIVKLGEAVNKDKILYLVFDHPLDLSNRMGIPVHGIIGYDLFRDFIVLVDYMKKRLIVYAPENYPVQKCGNCDELDLTFHRNKPYVNISGNIGGKTLPLSLLVDSGSGDALWLFENEEGINLPEENFHDFLGYGISGSIYGSRSRIGEINFGKYQLPLVTASFPDTLYYKGIEIYEKRNGSIGSQVLSRFLLTIDYPSKKIRFKPNRNFSDPFEYDMSGVVVAHDGFTVIRDIMRNPLALRDDDKNQSIAGNMVYKSTYDIKFSLEPQYKIVEIRPGSPALRAGLEVDDILLRVNGKPAFKYTLSEITNLLSSKEGKKIRLVVERNGIEKYVVFFLERTL